jgi:hypothetical protein
MKKIIIFIFLVFLTGEIYAQFAFGLKLGYNASKLHTGLDSIKSSFSSGFHVGAFARIGKKVYLQPELYYTLQGSVLTSNLSNWKQKITIGTLDIPVLVGFKIINLKAINWRIMVGPMASFIVNSKINNVNSAINPVTSADLKKTNWYIQAGTGVDFLFLTLDLRYQLGLNKMITDAAKATFNASNNLWVVSLGFKIL